MSRVAVFRAGPSKMMLLSISSRPHRIASPNATPGFQIQLTRVHPASAVMSPCVWSAKTALGTQSARTFGFSRASLTSAAAISLVGSSSAYAWVYRLLWKPMALQVGATRGQRSLLRAPSRSWPGSGPTIGASPHAAAAPRPPCWRQVSTQLLSLRSAKTSDRGDSSASSSRSARSSPYASTWLRQALGCVPTSGTSAWVRM
mmetsp:Transcript_40998/g.131845  ORF Transcript_40998/g.131845 Transcript_40998/m.131845 type:complete len:202 (+) Transcript_40998:523-1128(+)